MRHIFEIREQRQQNLRTYFMLVRCFRIFKIEQFHYFFRSRCCWVILFIMDQMMSYCGHSHDSSSEFPDDFLHSAINLIEQELDEAQNITDFDESVSKLEEYRACIRRQESEINSYRKHIETIEEDYTKVLKLLNNAEANVKEYSKKIDNYEETICSLKNDLDTFYKTDQSLNQAQSTISHDDLSFSHDFERKVNLTKFSSVAIMIC